MAQNFNEMNKEELETVLNSDGILTMSAAELRNLQKAVKEAGLLSVQYDNMLNVAINNRTYEEIKNSDKYTQEEKDFALAARNEYNKEIYALTKNENYNAAEIMSRAVETNGQYHFDNLSKGEMDFLLENRIVRLNQMNVAKQYNIGQEKNRDFSKEVAENTENLTDDVKKSAEFWGNFSDEKKGISFIVQALKDNSVKVEAKKNNQTVFTGVDRGNKGFDVVEKENKTEPFAIHDLIIKKAKATNPKAKIRIKDNVQDPVLRNKILIACAKNNMEPIGNLPEGFDFEALKDMVKDVKDIATINALAENLYDQSSIEVVQDNPEKENRTAAAAVIPTATNETKQDNKDNTTAAAVILPTATNETKQENKDNVVAAAAIPVGNGGNQQNNTSQTQVKEEKEEAKRPWWKKAWDKTKKYVVGGLLVLAAFVCGRSCSNNGNGDKDNQNATKVENLGAKIDSLSNVINQRSIRDCEEISRIYDDGFADGFAARTKECEENKPKKTVRRQKTTPRKVAPKKEILGQKLAGVEKMDGVNLQIRGIPAEKLPDEVENVDLPEPKKEEVKDTPKKTSGWTHGKFYTSYNDHGRY